MNIDEIILDICGPGKPIAVENFESMMDNHIRELPKATTTCNILSNILSQISEETKHTLI